MASSNSQPSTSFDFNMQDAEATVLNLKVLKPLDDVLRCRICFDYFTNCMMTKCSHNYCSVCIRRYMNYKSQCPTCFQVATEPELQNNRLMDEILRIYKKIRETLQMPSDSMSKSFEQPTSSKPIPKDKPKKSTKHETAQTETHKSSSDDVSCPVCYKIVPNSRINIHLDSCLKQSEDRGQRKFLPKLVYHLLSDKDIRKKLKDHGLSVNGNRQVLIRRHKNFITLYNANCDSLDPKSVPELVLEIERQELEERIHAQQKNVQVNKKSDPSLIEKEHESYIQEHKSQFSALIQDVQDRELGRKFVKEEFDFTEGESNITDETGNVIGKSTLRIGSDLDSDPIIVKEEPSDYSFQDTYVADNIKIEGDSFIDNEFNLDYKKTSELSFPIKKIWPAVKVKADSPSLLDVTANQELNVNCPSSESGSKMEMVAKIDPKGEKQKMKEKRLQYTPSNLKNALEAIASGMKVARASRLFKVPRTTLRNKLTHKSPVECIGRGGPHSVLGKDVEDMLAKWIIDCISMGFRISKQDVCSSVKKILDASNVQSTLFTDNHPGKKWYSSFLKRHPSITQKHGEFINKSKGSLTEEKIREWFQKMRISLKDHQDVLKDPMRVFSVDEICFFLSSKGDVVLGSSRRRTPEESVPDMENFTTLFVVNASGDFAPPLTIYRHSAIPTAVIETFPFQWNIENTENGCMNEEKFYNYISNVFLHFLIESNIPRPVIVFLDPHKFQLTFHLSKFCKDEGIILVAFYPNSAHILDVAVFGPLRNNWKEVMRKWQGEIDIKEITKSDIPSILFQVISEEYVETNIKSAFAVTGLFPFDENKIDYTKCIIRKSLNSHVSKQLTVGDVLKHLNYQESHSYNMSQEFTQTKNDEMEESSSALFFSDILERDFQDAELVSPDSSIMNEIFQNTGNCMQTEPYPNEEICSQNVEMVSTSSDTVLPENNVQSLHSSTAGDNNSFASEACKSSSSSISLYNPFPSSFCTSAQISCSVSPDSMKSSLNNQSPRTLAPDSVQVRKLLPEAIESKRKKKKL